jgi:T3SS (YopN, CesT) and YbjN peptide-binding chaperone 1
MSHKIFNKDDHEIQTDTPLEMIEKTIEDVQAFLDKDFPDHLSFGNGTFTISRGSTQVMIIVRPFTSDETSVECISQVVTGADISSDLMNFLLRKNAELHFGAFGLYFDNTITFSHSITGTNLDENELVNTLNAVAIIADHYDDKIMELAGGKRAADLLNDLTF